jgi:hypothetical protein
MERAEMLTALVVIVALVFACVAAVLIRRALDRR